MLTPLGPVLHGGGAVKLRQLMRDRTTFWVPRPPRPTLPQPPVVIQTTVINPVAAEQQTWPMATALAQISPWSLVMQATQISMALAGADPQISASGGGPDTGHPTQLLGGNTGHGHQHRSQFQQGHTPRHDLRQYSHHLMALGGSIGHPNQSVPHHHLYLSSAPLLSAWTTLLLFRSYFSNTYLLNTVSPTCQGLRESQVACGYLPTCPSI